MGRLWEYSGAAGGSTGVLSGAFVTAQLVAQRSGKTYGLENGDGHCPSPPPGTPLRSRAGPVARAPSASCLGNGQQKHVVLPLALVRKIDDRVLSVRLAPPH